MKAGLSMSLGLVFVGLATLNVITLLESSRPSQTPQKRARAIKLHRAGGYLFIGLFAMMVWFMCKRLIGSPEGLLGDAALHIDFAVLLVPLLFVKVVVARKHKSHYSILFPLGLSIYAISVMLVFIRLLPFTLGRIDPSSSIVKYSILLPVLFCFFLARLALRSEGSSVGTSSRSSDPQRSLPVLQPAPNTFSLKLIRSEVQTRDAKTLCFRVQEGKQPMAKPGQFLTFDLNIDGNRVVRCYSICSSHSILTMFKSLQSERKTVTFPFF
jgi:uncharacterized membrane protein YhdT